MTFVSGLLFLFINRQTMSSPKTTKNNFPRKMNCNMSPNKNRKPNHNPNHNIYRKPKKETVSQILFNTSL